MTVRKELSGVVERNAERKKEKEVMGKRDWPAC